MQTVASIIHTFEMRNMRHTFYDQGSNSSYYTNKFWGQNSDIEDRTKAMSIRNTIGLAMNEGFKKWVKMGLTFFATHEYRRYGQPTHLPDTTRYDYEAENAKMSIRNARRDAIEEFKKLVKNGLSEDIQKDAEEDVQKVHDKYIAKVEALYAAKEKEIMTV